MDKDLLLDIVESIKKRSGAKIKETVDELIKRGVPNGCFQDYALLGDIISLLGYLYEE